MRAVASLSYCVLGVLSRLWAHSTSASRCTSCRGLESSCVAGSISRRPLHSQSLRDAAVAALLLDLVSDGQSTPINHISSVLIVRSARAVEPKASVRACAFPAECTPAPLFQNLPARSRARHQCFVPRGPLLCGLVSGLESSRVSALAVCPFHASRA